VGRPGFWDYPENAQQIIQQFKLLNALLKPFKDLEAAVADLGALAELCDEDASLEGELGAEVPKVERQLAAIELIATLTGPHDASNAYLVIQAGAGGTEACDWAQMLLRLYARWAERHGYGSEVISRRRIEEGRIYSATLRIVGDYAHGRLQGEAGVHCLVRATPSETHPLRLTSCATVDVLPEAGGPIELGIRLEDIRRDTFRLGGLDLQSAFKVESGVRFIHVPTGITAESICERSAHKMGEHALNLLKAKLYRVMAQKPGPTPRSSTMRRESESGASPSGTTPCGRTRW
jgi:peptide chain release factor 2